MSKNIPPFEGAPASDVYTADITGTTEQYARYDIGKVTLYLGVVGLARVKQPDLFYTMLVGSVVEAVAEDESVADFSDFDLFTENEHGTFYQHDTEKAALWVGHTSVLLDNYLHNPRLSAFVSKEEKKHVATVVSEPIENADLTQMVSHIRPWSLMRQRLAGAALQPTRPRRA